MSETLFSTQVNVGRHGSVRFCAAVYPAGDYSPEEAQISLAARSEGVQPSFVFYSSRLEDLEKMAGALVAASAVLRARQGAV